MINARDIVAVLLILGCILLKYQGYNGYVDLSLVAIVGYYFSKRTFEEKNTKKKKIVLVGDGKYIMV